MKVSLRIVARSYWLNLIEKEWDRHSVIVLSGVRRAGKTYLCRSLENVEYFDCERPSDRDRLQDPESFLAKVKGKRIVLDEIHRIDNPSQILKIAADYFPDIKLIATGSSAIEASAKFKDTLTGRKSAVLLTPMNSLDLCDFGFEDVERRLGQGGLPQYFLAEAYEERDFVEWVDSYWAKDVLSIFRLEKGESFRKFIDLLFADSGGVFEATRYAHQCEVSRPTIKNYLAILSATFATYIVRPFSTRRVTEIVSAPKVYAFDTGPIRLFKRWTVLRPSDLGLLWEHYVLNQLISTRQSTDINYWRDKRGHEVDFVLRGERNSVNIIECKWSASSFDARSLRAFRRLYPDGVNRVVCNDVRRPYTKKFMELEVEFVGIKALEP